MYHGDQKIHLADIEQIDRQARDRTLPDELIEVMQREPLLMEMMAEHWELIDRLMGAMPMPMRNKLELRRQITLLATKPLVLLDRAHRRLWDDTLPGETKSGGSHA